VLSEGTILDPQKKNTSRSVPGKKGLTKKGELARIPGGSIKFPIGGKKCLIKETKVDERRGCRRKNKEEKSKPPSLPSLEDEKTIGPTPGKKLRKKKSGEKNQKTKTIDLRKLGIWTEGNATANTRAAAPGSKREKGAYTRVPKKGDLHFSKTIVTSLPGRPWGGTCRGVSVYLGGRFGEREGREKKKIKKKEGTENQAGRCKKAREGCLIRPDIVE